MHHTLTLVLLAKANADRGRLDDAGQAARRARDELAEIHDAGTLTRLLEEVERDIGSAIERATAGNMTSALSDAELAVLRLIRETLGPGDRSAPVRVREHGRTHRRTLYRKLGVHSREEAVARAYALELFGQESPPGRTVPEAGHPDP